MLMKHYQYIIISVLVLFIMISIVYFFIYNKNSKTNNKNHSTELYDNSQNTRYDNILTVNEEFQMSTLEFPRGIVVPFFPSQNNNAIPQGWAICNGKWNSRFTWTLYYGQKT